MEEINRRKSVRVKIMSYFVFLNKMLKEVNVSAHASSAAFFLFLSIIPIVMIVGALLQHVPMFQEEIWYYMSQAVVPERIINFLKEIINSYQGNSMTLVSISALVTIWSASKGMLALIRGMNAVNEIKESRNYFLLRLRALLYTLLLLITIMLSVVLLVFGNALVEVLIPNVEAIGYIWNWFKLLRYVLVAGIIAVVFCSLYCLLPNNRFSWIKQLPGAIFTSIFWILYSFFFSIYVDYFNGFSMYGSLTTVIIVMIWLYFCMYIFFCGALINRFWEEA